MSFVEYPAANDDGPPDDEPWEPTDADDPQAPPPSSDTIKPTAWPVLDVEAIFGKLEPVNYLLEPLDLCPGAPCLVAGYGFSGKTLTLQSMAMSVATGQRVWGVYQARQGRVLHIDYEQGARLTRERYQRLAAGLMVTPHDIGDRLVLVPMPQVYLDQCTDDFLAKKLDGFDLCIIDSLRAACPSIEENDSTVRLVLDNLNRASEKTGCSVVVVHHARKPQKDSAGGAKASIRGSGALFDACGSVLVLEANKGEPTRVMHEKARTSGRLLDDFQLVIQDADVDGNTRGGLIVTAEGCAAKESVSASFHALMGRLLDDLATTGPAASKSALAARVKGKVSDKFAAIDQLVMDGKIRVTGKRHELAE